MHEEIKTDIHLGGIQVSGMLHGPWVIAIVSVLDYWIKDFSKHLQCHFAKKSRVLSLDKFAQHYFEKIGEAKP